jgi:hypothetical protein
MDHCDGLPTGTSVGLSQSPRLLLLPNSNGSAETRGERQDSTKLPERKRLAKVSGRHLKRDYSWLRWLHLSSQHLGG